MTKRKTDPAMIEAALNDLAAEVEADDYELPAGTQIRVPAPGEGRAFLEQFAGADELDRISRSGRPSLSGSGTSPKRQVRLPAALDAALEARALAEGCKPSAVMREAIEHYLQPAFRVACDAPPCARGKALSSGRAHRSVKYS